MVVMARPDKEELALARQARLAAIVIAVTMLLWLAAQFVGVRLGLPARFVFLFVFEALAAFFWALVVAFQIWRARRSKE